MSGPAVLAIATGLLVDAGLKSTLVLGGGGLLALALRGRPAATRHAVWASSLLALPALPLLALERGPTLALDRPSVFAVWALGVAVSLAPLARSLWQLRQLEARARRDPETPGLLHVDDLPSPLTWGWLRPRIAMPAEAHTWPSARREAALAHERAHIARRDWAVHLLTRVVLALFWFQPLAWWAHRRLALEAEHAADDAVLASGTRPSDYAALLLSLATRNTPSAALGAGTCDVSQRIRAVLTPRARSATRLHITALAVAVAALTLPALASQPLWEEPAEATLTCKPAEATPPPLLAFP